MKVKLHFNRINMQRKDPRIWSAHTSRSCNMSERVQIRHNGVVVAETVFQPEKRSNPRAWIETKGTVTYEDGITVITV
jgi:hypothetical protein